MLDSIRKIYDSQPPSKLVLSKSNFLFKTGEIFSGTVLKRLASGDVLIKAKGKEFSAKTDLKLQPGTRYQFQAVRAGRKSEVKVLGGLSRDLKPLLELLSACRKDGQKMGDLLRSLDQFQSKKGMSASLVKELSNLSLFLPGLNFNGEEGSNPSWFSRFLLASGLFWESRLARFLAKNKSLSKDHSLFKDLKGKLLSIKQNLIARSDNTLDADSLKEKIDQVLKIIEREQLLNLSLSRSGLGWYFFIPGLGEDEFKGAEILVNQDREEGVIRFCLLSNFSNLGAVLSKFFLRESHLELSLQVENKKTEGIIIEYLDELREDLRKIGFSPGNISCCIGEEIGDYITRVLEERGSEESFHLII